MGSGIGFGAQKEDPGGQERDLGPDTHLPPSASSGWESRGMRGLVLLPDTEAALAESVWAFAGISR